MKLNKKFFAVLAAAFLMLMCAVPVFAESASATDDAPADVLLIAPAPASNGDVVTATDIIEELAGKDAPANVGTSFMIMGYGMLGIFVVMIIIMLVILLLNVTTKPRRK